MQTWGRVRLLARADSPSPGPDEWATELSNIRAAMCADAASRTPGLDPATFDALFTAQWYRDSMAILALNTMGLFAPLQRGAKQLQASAMFITASLFNHSCSPNIAVRCEGDAAGAMAFSFVAEEDIPQGEAGTMCLLTWQAHAETCSQI